MTLRPIPDYWRADGGLLPALVVIAIGILLRLFGLNWDDGALLHADERYLVMVMSAVSWPDSVAQYFASATSPLNPLNLPELNWYVYGTLPLFLAKLVAAAPGAFGFLIEPVIVSRLLSVLADTGTVVAVFILGRMLFTYGTGLLAASLYSLAVLPIQLAHFFTVDPFVNFFLALSLIQAVRLTETRAYGPTLLLGLWWGCALASKISALAFAPIVLAALAAGIGRHGIRFTLGRLGLCLLVALATFRMLQPYAFTGWWTLDPRFITALGVLARAHEFSDWSPPSFQWIGRHSLLFALQNMASWGMGVLLFAAGAAGAVLTTIKLWQTPKPGPFLLLCWLAILLTVAAIAFNPTMRYQLSAYPIMALLAAAFLMSVARDSNYSARRYGPMLLVVAGTLLWALAFTAIYRAPTTRVAASDWIYAHVPAQAVLGVEYWDDALPVPRPGKSTTRYTQRTLRLTDPATDTKRKELLRELAQVDYVIVSSNRGYASLTRLRGQFPVASRYYELLFGGLAGFDLVAEFSSYPRLPGVIIEDNNAAEAFTVHDHPRVFIFAKSADFSLPELTEELEAVSLPERPRQLSTDSTPTFAAVRPVTEEDLQTAGNGQALHLLHWILILWMAGIGGNAISRRLYPGGAVPGRVLLLAVGAYVVATGSYTGLMTVQQGSMVFLSFLVCVTALVIYRDSGLSDRVCRIRETVFWGVFAFFLLLRAHNPAIFWGERPMDFAILNAFLRAEYLPLVDPWFAGSPLQYHAWGQYFMSVLGRLAGTPPALLYNLATAVTPALAAELFFWILVQVTGGTRQRLWPALVGTALILFCGNLYYWTEFPTFAETTFLHFWQASRIVPGTINEFPFWAAVFGDLHSHLLGMIFSALFLAGIIVWHGGRASLVGCGLMTIALASLALTNTWALPVYLLVLLLFALASDRKQALVQAASVVLVSLVMALPYWGTPLGRSNIQLVDSPIGLSDGLVLFGPFLGVLLMWSLDQFHSRKIILALIVASLSFTLLIGNLRGLATIALALVLASLYRQPRQPQREVAGLLATAGLLTLIGSEYFTVFDRMNTVFKYQFEAWILLGLASAIALSEMARRRAATIACALILMLGMPTSALTLWAWWNNPKAAAAEPTLDGLAYLAGEDRPQALAVDWLQKLPGQPALLEAVGPPYGPYARLSAYTGLPSLLGWNYHVWQHGHDHGTILQRQQRVEATYTLPGSGETAAKPAIHYAALCQLEKDTYGQDAGSHWREAGWRQVFHSQSCDIWRTGNAGISQ